MHYLLLYASPDFEDRTVLKLRHSETTNEDGVGKDLFLLTKSVTLDVDCCA